jgi:hypothetical protein
MFIVAGKAEANAWGRDPRVGEGEVKGKQGCNLANKGCEEVRFRFRADKP